MVAGVATGEGGGRVWGEEGDWGLAIYVGQRRHLPTLYWKSYERAMCDLVVGVRREGWRITVYSVRCGGSRRWGLLRLGVWIYCLENEGGGEGAPPPPCPARGRRCWWPLETVWWSEVVLGLARDPGSWHVSSCLRVSLGSEGLSFCRLGRCLGSWAAVAAAAA